MVKIWNLEFAYLIKTYRFCILNFNRRSLNRCDISSAMTDILFLHKRSRYSLA
ncbi:unnamed protein product [Phyllotreta striolata]|uniref:Uncharacterized protein n=1 Tax=Phyllotreta striolata TaxID=444603 RepID=A0A9N9TV43_PHYSR|nr:unnamed protein product [Phyllotreta striolata]